MGLCNEVSALKGSLAAIKKTLNGCKPGVTLVEHGLWQQIELCLANCQTTLNERGILVDNIQGSSRTKGFGWRARAVVDLSNYSDNITKFQDKLQKSNCVLNVVLHTMLLFVLLLRLSRYCLARVLDLFHSRTTTLRSSFSQDLMISMSLRSPTSLRTMLKRA